jgi:hypothetical protein
VVLLREVPRTGRAVPVPDPSPRAAGFDVDTVREGARHVPAAGTAMLHADVECAGHEAALETQCGEVGFGGEVAFIPRIRFPGDDGVDVGHEA